MLELDPRRRADARVERLTTLVYELLDAHDDTMRLLAGAEQPLAAEPSVDDVRREAHLDYLRDLQRVGRELLARDAA